MTRVENMSHLRNSVVRTEKGTFTQYLMNVQISDDVVMNVGPDINQNYQNLNVRYGGIMNIFIPKLLRDKLSSKTWECKLG